MDISAVDATRAAMAAAAQQPPIATETQLAMSRENADRQLQLARTFTDTGLGQAIDVGA
jgi:hypothetical protein